MEKKPWGTVAFMVGAIAAGVAIGVFTAPVGHGMGRKGDQFCDKYVEVLLTSDNLTEVTRAGIIVREAPCSLQKRIYQPEER